MEKRLQPRTKAFKVVKCEDTDCELQDISNGGVCIISDRNFEPGSTIRVTLPTPRLARVVWRDLLIRGSFILGLEFLTEDP
jgi:hypothetical protein